ncbi:MAG: 4Fe-4S binding protein [Clostridia bacterium]|nr:4Fe-4S binding protein [Clostridia bacterium]
MFKKSSGIIRWVILVVILGGSVLIHYLHLKGGANYPSVHSICPYGGLENLWAWLSGRANIQKIFSGTMVLFFLTIVFALVFRRSFCGNICPFGALQELLGLILSRKIKVPAALDKHLHKVKYFVLILSALMAWVTLSLWLSPYDPWAAFAHMFKGEEMLEEYLIGTIILALTVVAAFFIRRPFCKYLCPAGALYGIIGKLSPYKILRDEKKCKKCGICTKKCPMDIEVHSCERVTTAECISCNRCVEACPGAGTMISAKFAALSLKPAVAVIASVAVFFGSIFVLDSAGLYRVSLPTQAEVAEKGEYIKIRDLRGSMTIEQGAFYTGKGLDDFYKIMEIPSDVPKDTQMKHISQYVKGYDFHQMKAKKGSE